MCFMNNPWAAAHVRIFSQENALEKIAQTHDRRRRRRGSGTIRCLGFSSFLLLYSLDRVYYVRASSAASIRVEKPKKERKK